MVLGLLAACGGTGGVGGTADAGKVRVLVTDSPFAFKFVESASVVISKVELRKADAAKDDDSSAGDDDSGAEKGRGHGSDGHSGEKRWVTVFEGSAEMDLVPLTGGVSSLLASIDVPAGTYDEARMIVDAGSVTLLPEAKVAGDSHTFTIENGGLKIPSGRQTGIKVKIHPAVEVSTGLSTDLVLDFDLARNFHFNGSPRHAPGVKRVIFTPCVRAANHTESGRIVLDVVSDAGTPEDSSDDFALEGAAVTATDLNGESAGSAVADASGHVEMVLAPGTYDVTVSAADHTDASLPGLTVVKGNALQLGTVTLAGPSGDGDGGDGGGDGGSGLTFSGTVFCDSGTPEDPSDDVPLQGATVEILLTAGGPPVAVETTDENGDWQVTGLADDLYDISVTEGLHVGQVIGSVVPSAVVDVTLSRL